MCMRSLIWPSSSVTSSSGGYTCHAGSVPSQGRIEAVIRKNEDLLFERPLRQAMQVCRDLEDYFQFLERTYEA